MVLEGFFNHPLLIWEWMSWVAGIALLRLVVGFVWKEGKKKGRKDFDEYKKWEKIFKDEKHHL